MAYDRAILYVAASSAEQTAYANTNRLKTVNNVVYLSFPMKYIAKGGIKARPNVREEIKAKRDDNTRNLTRVTADGMKSSFTISILGGLHNAQKNEIMSWFTSHESVAKERKISLLYFDSDSDTYKVSNFYRGDTEWTYLYTTDTDIIWDAYDIELVEY